MIDLTSMGAKKRNPIGGVLVGEQRELDPGSAQPLTPANIKSVRVRRELDLVAA